MIGGFLSGLWGKLALVGAVVLGLLALVGVIRKGGTDAERVRENAANQRVRARVDAVQPPAAGEVEDRLNKGSF